MDELPSEIVWHNSQSGETQLWLMKGDRIGRRVTVTDEKGAQIHVGPPWSIAGVGSGNAFVRRMRDRIHERYLSSGGRNGPLGFPTSDVGGSSSTACRQYRGGEVTAERDTDGPLGVTTQALKTREASVRFIGFRCIKEAVDDRCTTANRLGRWQGPSHDV